MALIPTGFSLAVDLDHVGWWVDDLVSVRAEFERLGFNVTQPASLLTGSGRAAPQDEGQRSSHVMFRNTYLELTTVAGNAIPAHLMQYRGGSGLKIIALGCVDADALHDELASAGWDLVAPARSERRLDYGDRDEPVRFRWFMATPTQFPEVLVCVVEHLDRERLFDPKVTEQSNQVIELTEVLMLANDPESSFGRYRALESAAGTAAGWLTFLSRKQAELAYPGLSLPVPSTSDAADCTPMGVVLRSGDLDFLRRRLGRQSGGQLWFAAPGGTIVVVREF